MVFCLGCLKKTLLPLVAISLLVTVGQLVLIFINNRIFGVIMFVLYILFFLAILIALCRDSVSMYSAATILLIIFVLGCTLIQAYGVDVRDLLNMSSAGGKAADGGNTGSGGTGGGVTAGGGGGAVTTEGSKGRKRGLLYQLSIPQSHWKRQEAETSWEAPEDILPVYPHTPPQMPMEFPSSNQMPDMQTIIYQPLPTLPPPPSILASTTLLSMPKVTIASKLEPNPRLNGFKVMGRPAGRNQNNDKPRKTKKFRWRNELRWVSNTLGVLHIVMIAVIICILYEMLFGGCYQYRTWC